MIEINLLPGGGKKGRAKGGMALGSAFSGIGQRIKNPYLVTAVSSLAIALLSVGGLHFTQLSAGGVHTCGIATGNAAYCWGWNGGGQVGDSTTANRLTPTPVWGGLPFTEISANPGSDLEGHTCAVTTGNVAYCWGTNHNGELGDSTINGHLIPTAVFGTLQVAYVGAARGYGCALTSGQALHCWGINADGELGDGTTNQHLTPYPVAGSLAFAQVSARFDHACGVTMSHTVYCWGTNDHGQLGDGTTTPRLAPTLVIQ